MGYKNSRLQYAFFADAEASLLPCDEACSNFLSSIGPGLLAEKLKSFMFTSVVTNSTVIIGENVFNLRLTPAGKIPARILPEGFVPAYIVTLIDEAQVSAIVRELKRQKLNVQSFDALFGDMSTPIFVDDADGNVIYLNSSEEHFSGMRSAEVVGRNLSDLAKAGLLSPTISPIILRTGDEMTILQTIGGSKLVVISGIPIFDDFGEPSLIVTCSNEVKKDVTLRGFSRGEILGSGPRMTGLGDGTGMGDGAGLGGIGDGGERATIGGIGDGGGRVTGRNAGQLASVNVIAESDTMRSVLSESISIAHYHVPVLILGESGTGKEIIANVIHAASPWRGAPFVKINCSSISASLLESELFGYEKGAFTGAAPGGKAGLFDEAAGGTLLLDEIGDMPQELQAKLLRVLQSGEFYRVGGTKPQHVNVRIMAATNKDLFAMTNAGHFRSDLYYRLNPVTIYIPPLRERREDIAPLMNHYLYLFNKQYGSNKNFAPPLVGLAEAYHWPGNVRELENVVRRLVITCHEDELTPENLRAKYSREFEARDGSASLIGEILGSSPRMTGLDVGLDVGRTISLKELTSAFERKIIEEAISSSKNTREAAARLGISQATLLRKRG